jgi:hypothetical protein
MDLDISVTFYTSSAALSAAITGSSSGAASADTSSVCALSGSGAAGAACGNVRLMQTSSGGRGRAEGVLISTVHATVYTVGASNYLGNAATESSGARVEVDGLNAVPGAAVFKLPSHAAAWTYAQDPGPWLGGMFRDASRFARIACIAGSPQAVSVTWTPLYSSAPQSPLATCAVEPPPENDPGARCRTKARFVPRSEFLADLAAAATPTTAVDTTNGSGGSVGTDLEYNTLFPVDEAARASPGRDVSATVGDYAPAVRPAASSLVLASKPANVTVSARSASDGQCMPAVPLARAQAQCAAQGQRLCSSAEADQGVAAAGCGAAQARVWTSDACQGNVSTGTLAAPGLGACGAPACSEMAYPGERCWHDGARAKSCLASWRAAGVLQEGRFVNTRALCQLCAADEHCDLLTMVGFYRAAAPPVLYDFQTSCAARAKALNLTASTVCVIPKSKLPGRCLVKNATCGARGGVYTVEDGECFPSLQRLQAGGGDSHEWNPMACGCAGLVSEQCVSADEAAAPAAPENRPLCCPLAASADSGNAGTEAGSSVGQRPYRLELPTFASTGEVWQTPLKITPPQAAVALWASIFTEEVVAKAAAAAVATNGSAIVLPACRSLTASVVTLVDQSASAKLSDGQITVRISVPLVPGRYYACTLRSGATSSDANTCAGAQFCSGLWSPVTGTTDAALDQCLLLEIACSAPGRIGASCAACDVSLDSDADGTPDCTDLCPFDNVIRSAADLTPLRPWCGTTASAAAGASGRLLDAAQAVNVSRTLSGRTCQRWTAQSPHAHSVLEARRNRGLCGGPAGEGCAFPFFDAVTGRTESTACGGGGRYCTGANSSTALPGSKDRLACTACANKDLRFAEPDSGLGDHSYCRNPGNAAPAAWCFTTDPLVRWEYCAAPAPTVPGAEPSTPSLGLLLASRATGVARGSLLASAALSSAPVVFSAVNMTGAAPSSAQVSVAGLAVMPGFKQGQSTSFVHLGCAVGWSSAFALGVAIETAQSGAQATVAGCAAYCRARGYSLFALGSAGTRCSCPAQLPGSADWLHRQPDFANTSAASCATDGLGAAPRGQPCLFPYTYRGKVYGEGQCVRDAALMGGRPVCFVAGSPAAFGGCACRCSLLTADARPGGGPGNGALSVYSIASADVVLPAFAVADQNTNAIVALDQQWVARPDVRFLSTALQAPGAVVLTDDGGLVAACRLTGAIVAFDSHRLVRRVVPYPEDATISFASQGPAIVAADRFFLYTVASLPTVSTASVDGATHLVRCSLTDAAAPCTRIEMWNRYPSLDSLAELGKALGSVDMPFPRAIRTPAASGANVVYLVDALGGLFAFRTDTATFADVLAGQASAGASSAETLRAGVHTVAVDPDSDEVLALLDDRVVAVGSNRTWRLAVNNTFTALSPPILHVAGWST